MTQTQTEPQSQDGVALDGPSTPSLHVAQLPLQEWGFYNCPAIPFWADAAGNPDPTHLQTTLQRMENRAVEGKAAYDGLSTVYTIGGQTKTAYEFLYGSLPPAPADPTSPLTQLALDKPDQFTLSWTTYEDVYKNSQDIRGPFSDTLKDTHKDIATRSFWPTIAYFGLPYNLLVLSKVGKARAAELAAEFGDAWTAEDMDAQVAAGVAYEIDMRILAEVESFTPPGSKVRFTPGSITLLTQDAQSKALTPVSIKLFTANGTTRVYRKADNAWIYALQVAKTSITVWGIWLGHVYHWHIVTAAMQMSMYNRLPAGHRLWPLLQPQSQSLIDFDFVLLQHLFDKISPPTPVAGPMPLLALLDRFAENRGFSEDDPIRELQKRGLDVKDFTVKKDWDAYPVVGYLLRIWKISQAFVKPVVEKLYANDGEVANDAGLKAWMDASKDPSEGNVQGLPDVNTRQLLSEVLTSLLYRVTVHGAGSLTPSVNPALAFVSNFPPCLQSTDMPEPSVQLSDKQLLERMPHTGTIGGMTTFYFTFVYSPPYRPLIPRGGLNLDPYWPPSEQACNDALFKYREGIRSFVKAYTEDWNTELARIRGVPVGSPPSYAENQYEQWPRSIEI